MCGISGYIGELDKSAFAGRLIEAMQHRGPDGGATLSLQGADLSMNRLRIRSLPSDAVPFRVGEKFIVAFNGEVYGRLLPIGTNHGPSPSGGENEILCVIQSDTGAPDGMFAMAVYDTQTEMVSLLRDPYGIKPIFLRQIDGGTVFASELGALAELDLPDVNRDALVDILAVGYPLSGQTAYQGVTNLTPGARADFPRNKPFFFTNGTTTLPLDGVSALTPSDTRAAIHASVARCMLGDRPFGLALSGGLDSTILAYELNSLGIENVTSISVLIDGIADGVRHLSELRLPENGAWQTWRHEIVSFSLEDLPDMLENAVLAYGQPARMSSLPLYHALARGARNAGIVVLLLGEGADEVFLGYESYRSWLSRPPMASILADLWSFACPEHRFNLLKGLFGTRELETLRDRFEHAFADSARLHRIDALRNLEWTLSLQPLLLRTDTALMRYGIEGRTPFLHNGLPERATNTPDTYHWDGKRTKPLLRDAYAGVLSQVKSPKMPFRLNFKALTDLHNGDWMSDLLHTRVLRQSLGISLERLDTLLASAREGDQEATQLAFALCTTSIWLKKRKK
jgi:asparagine synthase (glutamine-hydrolysing)